MKNLSASKRNSSAASVATKAFAWVLSIMLVVTGLSPSLAANNKAAGKGVTNTVTKSEAQKGASNKAYKDSKKAGDKEKATLPEENKKKENNKVSKADKKPADINKKDAGFKGKPANNNDKMQKAKAKGSREGASPARLSKKKAAALKKEAADEADAAVWRGFGAYYANLSVHNKKSPKSQNINPKDSLKIKAAKNLKNSLDTKINKKFSKNVDYKKTSKTYGKKEKKRGPTLDKEKIVDLNASGSVKAIWKNKFQPPEFDITFDKNGGVGEMPSVSKKLNSLYTLPECAFTPPLDKVFAKWEVTVGKGIPMYKQPGESIVVSGNVTVKAIWIKLPFFDITFDKNGGVGEMPTEHARLSSLYTLPECAFTPPSSKVFDKWEVTVGTEMPVDKQPGESIVVSGNVTVKAIWKMKSPFEVAITFDKNGGKGDMPSEYTRIYSFYTLPACAFTAPFGKVFDKWLVSVGTEAAVEKMPGETVLASDNVTVKAMWRNASTLGKVNIRFNANGGSGSMPTKQVDKDSEYTLPVCGYTAPEGKVFDKWEVTVGTETPVDKQLGETIVASNNVRVKAIWREKSPLEVDIKFDKNGGEGDMPSEYTRIYSFYTLPACAFTAPFGKVFDKWLVSVGTEAAVEKMPGETVLASDNVTVKAMWRNASTPGKVNIRFNANGGSGSMPTKQVDKDSEYTLPVCGYTAPEGKVFDKWEVTVGTETPVDKQLGETIVASNNVRVKAIWREKSPLEVDIKFDKNGGEGDMPSEYTRIYSFYTLPACAFTAPFGKVFDKWLVSVGTEAAVEKMPGETVLASDNVTVKAMWRNASTLGKVNIRFNANGGSGSMPTKQVDKDSEYTLPVCGYTAPEGKVFDKWEVTVGTETPVDKQLGETIVASNNVRVKAIWREKSPLEVDIKFDKNGGEGDMPSEYTRIYSFYTLPACAFTAPFGKVFDKWLVSVGTEAAVEKMPGETVLASDNVTVKAMWRNASTLGKVNIRFNANGGSGSMPTKQVDKDSEYTLPVCGYTAPEGKVFDKWEVTVGTETPVDKQLGETIVASNNVRVKAIWREKSPLEVDIKFDKNGGEGDMPSEYTRIYSFYTLPACAFTAPFGKVFDKWLVSVGTAAAVEKMPGDTVVASDNVTVKAMWKNAPTPGKVNIKFNANGGSGSMPTKQVDKNSEYTLPVCGYTAPEGKEFDKWSVTVGLGAAVNKNPGESIMASDNVTVKALWKESTVPPAPGKVNVTFDSNGGTGMMAPKQVDKDSEYTLPVCSFTAPEGKEFDKWSVTVGLGAAVNKNPGESIMASDNVTVKALWKESTVPPAPGKVNVTFDSNGGTGMMAPKQVDKDSEYTLPVCSFTAPEGKEFDKWSVTVGLGAAVNKNPGESVIASDNVTAKALWKESTTPPAPGKVKVTFNANGGSGVMNVVEVNKDSNYKLPTCAFTAPAGKEFDKWLVTVGTAAAVEKMPGDTVLASDNVTVKAMWKNVPAPGKVDIKFNANGGSGSMPTKQVDKDSEYTLPVCGYTAPEGKEFDKWSVTVGSNAPVEKKPGESVIASGNVTVKALWKESTTPGKVRVTLDGNGGALAGGFEATLNVEEGSTIKAQLEVAVTNNMFTKPGYKLIGFSKSKFATAADYNVDAPVYNNFTLYAVYEEAHELTTVTIKYSDIDLGEDAKIEDVSVGKPIGAKLDGNARDRDGYRFLGYSKMQNAEKPDFFKKSIVTENLVIYPVYKEAANEDKVKVAFKLNDGTDASLKTEEVTRYESLGNKMPTKDKVAERDGYLFTGWAKSKSAKYPDFFRSTVVKGDMTVYAVWKSLYNEKLGQAVLKASAKTKGYELVITPPAANLHTGFEIFRSEKKDFKPGSDTKIATIDRNILKYLDEKADNGKAYYYAVRAIDADGSYNGTKVTFIGKLSDKVLAAPLPKDKGVSAKVAGNGLVNLEFNKTIAAAKYKVVAEPFGKPSVPVTKEIAAKDVKQLANGKASINVDELPLGKLLVFKLTALDDANEELVAYSNSTAFMLPVPGRQTARAKTIKIKKGKKKVKIRILDFKFSKVKWATGYEVKLSINGKKPKRIILKGKGGFMVIKGKRIVLPKRGKFKITFVAFRKIGNLKYYGTKITKSFR